MNAFANEWKAKGLELYVANKSKNTKWFFTIEQKFIREYHTYATYVCENYAYKSLRTYKQSEKKNPPPPKKKKKLYISIITNVRLN